MKKHEKGMIFTCYFHPTNVVTDGAVMNLTIHWSLAVHVTLWPSLGILAGILLCVYTYFWKKHVRRKNKRKPSNDEMSDCLKEKLVNKSKPSKVSKPGKVSSISKSIEKAAEPNTSDSDL